jgi:cytochrome c6
MVVTITMVLSGAIGTMAADGKSLFQQFCAGCHYQGGNSVNPARPLTKLYREANGMRTTKDLVAKMRRGGQGMPAFSADRLPEPAARAIAEYIMVTFD